MLIKDSMGKYELKVDTERYIVYEKNIGLWTNEDMCRFHNEYLTKIFPLMRGREWIKCSDLHEYEFSDITDKITQHLSMCVENGFFGGIMIVETEEVAMQINRSVVYSDIIFSPIAFTKVEDAKKWLNSHWI
jgi:hypothetical protein